MTQVNSGWVGLRSLPRLFDGLRSFPRSLVGGAPEILGGTSSPPGLGVGLAPGAGGLELGLGLGLGVGIGVARGLPVSGLIVGFVPSLIARQ